jgi:hypothetical protein
MSPRYLGGRVVEGFLLPSGWFGHSYQTTGISVFFLGKQDVEEAATTPRTKVAAPGHNVS